MTPLTVVQLFGGVLVVILGLAGAVAYFRVQKSDATIEILKESDGAKQRLIESQRDQLADQDRRIVRLQADLEAAVERAQMLTDIVTARDAIAALSDVVAGLVSTTSTRYDTITRQHEAILSMLREAKA